MDPYMGWFCLGWSVIVTLAYFKARRDIKHNVEEAKSKGPPPGWGNSEYHKRYLRKINHGITPEH
jgi:hypothetical protein